MTIRVALYARVSTLDQVSGYSLDAQLAKMREYCTERNWAIHREYVDDGYSATSDQRPEFQILLRDIKIRLVDIVLVHKLDRFYRNLGKLLETVEFMRQHQTSLVSVEEKIDFDTPEGKMMLTSLGMVSEFYVNNLRGETKKGKLQRILSGQWNGDIPYGYCKGLCSHCDDVNGKSYCPNYGQRAIGDGKNLVAHPKDSIGLRMAFLLHASGQNSDLAIGKRLTGEGFRTNRKLSNRANPLWIGGPKAFGPDTVRDMLQNPFYLGMVKYKGSLYPGKHPALISQELFDRSQQARKDRARAKRTNTHKRIYLLGSILRCADHQHRMVGHTKKTAVPNIFRRTYRSTARLYHEKCAQPMVDADGIEKQIETWLGLVSLPEIWLDRIVQLIRGDTGLAESEYNRRMLASRLQRIRLLFVRGELDEAEYDRQRQKIQQQLDVKTESADLSAEVKQRLEDFHYIWALASTEQKRRLLQTMLKAVYVRGAEIVQLEPRREFTILFENR